MKKTYFNHIAFWAVCVLSNGLLFGQSSYVGEGSSIYFNSSILTNQVIQPQATSLVKMTSGSFFVGQGYVNGTVELNGNNSTTVPVGSGTTKSSVILASADANDVANVTYFLEDPSAISTVLDFTLTDYYLSDSEYWAVEKTAGTSSGYTVSGTNPIAGATYENLPPEGNVILVWYDGAKWVEYTGAPVAGFFSYAAEIFSLSTLDFNKSEFVLYPNPTNYSLRKVYFDLPNGVTSVKAEVYSLSGKTLKQITINNLERLRNELDVSYLKKGIYLVQFTLNKEQVITKKLIIQ